MRTPPVTDYNALGTAFVVISALLGILAIVILIAGASAAPKESTEDIEKIQ